jgi:hypothetical protein
VCALCVCVRARALRRCGGGRQTQAGRPGPGARPDSDLGHGAGELALHHDVLRALRRDAEHSGGVADRGGAGGGLPGVAGVEGEDGVLGGEGAVVAGEGLELDGRDHGALLGVLEEAAHLLALREVDGAEAFGVGDVDEGWAALDEDKDGGHAVAAGGIVCGGVAELVLEHQAARVEVTEEREDLAVAKGSGKVGGRCAVVCLGAEESWCPGTTSEKKMKTRPQKTRNHIQRYYNLSAINDNNSRYPHLDAQCAADHPSESFPFRAAGSF